MIDQKAREMTAHEAFIAVTAYDSGREAGIIEGRRQAFEEAAKVAEDEMKRWDNMAGTVGCGAQRQKFFKGKADAADAVWQKLTKEGRKWHVNH